MSAQVTIFLLGIYHAKSRSSLTILQRCEDVVRMIVDYTQADVLKALRLFLVNVRKLKGNDPLLRQLMNWKGGKEALRQLYPRNGWTLCMQLTDDTNLGLPDEAPNWRWLLEQLYAISWLGRGDIGSSLESDGDSYVFSQDQIQALRFLADSPNEGVEDRFVGHFGRAKTDAQLLSEMGVLFGEPSLQWFLNMFENIKDVYRWRSRFKEHMPIIKKKLIGPVGFSNLPNQVHRKSIKKGFQFTVMVVGESGLGKSTLVNTLFNTSLYPAKDSKVELTNEIPSTVEIQAIAADIEENGVKLKLTVVDTPGFGDFINNEESWAPILENIEARFDAFLDQENRVNRKRIVDTRVHACLYFIAPTGHALKPLDIEFMKRLAGRVNLIPVVAKSDTLTEEELKLFKSRILDDISANKINIYQPPTYENDDPETIQENKEIVSRIPFAVVGADRDIDMGNGRKIRGRKYPWGIIEVDNEEHCDFVKLRQMLIRTHMEELKEFTNEVLYESYRTAKLAETGGDIAVHSNPMKKLEADKAAHDAKLAKMESEMKAVFDQKVAEKEAKLKQAEEELYARHREMKEQLELKQRRMSPKPVQTPKKGFFSK
ncbi:hypothetical protein CcCBS67573_g08401 [Chytriomyces confervae]|uniref:Septin-type G domain-containing protein n=1 Tax=Chytriomyces confervae TaxID=246404 RepID=A0A507EMD8_9FUNG|nr:hypothetical protein CcCBS67573_g08401 [Chytriomyces confervae]